MADYPANPSHGILSGRRRRKIKESLTAYLFLLPAFLIIIVFGLWPVFHAFYVSLHKWNIRPKGSTCIPYWFAQIGLGSAQTLERTDCLDWNNYIALLGLQDPAAVLKMILAIVAGAFAYRLWRTRTQVSESQERAYIIGALVLALV
ncbi:MAG: sugar ABC transporter permease, partial [Anaerolineae bacterium]|nr:sugar ABC transporter permease [Anaerolineae bacterium]